VPQVVVYRVGWLTSLLFHLLVRLKHVSPVNIILNKMAVPELLQGKLKHQILLEKVSELLEDSPQRVAQLEDCQKLKASLAVKKPALEVAQHIESKWT